MSTNFSSKPLFGALGRLTEAKHDVPLEELCSETIGALFETHGIHFDARLRDEIVKRVDSLNLPSYSGFVMPKLTPVKGADGSITDVQISYPMDLTKQMLEYAGMPQ